MPAEARTSGAALLLALACSLLTGAAQLVLKTAAGHGRALGWTHSSTLLDLLAAHALLGFGFLAFLLALRRGELSTIYPVLAARYVWVTAATPLLFSTESLTPTKLVGAVLAAVGVALVARAREASG
jgi:multidrug transporter EmrE-like cation transporter